MLCRAEPCSLVTATGPRELHGAAPGEDQVGVRKKFCVRQHMSLGSLSPDREHLYKRTVLAEIPLTAESVPLGRKPGYF